MLTREECKSALDFFSAIADEYYVDSETKAIDVTDNWYILNDLINEHFGSKSMKTKKVILNKCYGGFGISKEAYQLYAKKKCLELYLYKREHVGKEVVYKKVKDDNSIFTTYLTKDFGDNAIINSEDFSKYHLYIRENYREDSTLIEVVEELGEKANGRYSELEIVEIPYDLDYVIDDYDGIETLHQKVQEW